MNNNDLLKKFCFTFLFFIYFIMFRILSFKTVDHKFKQLTKRQSEELISKISDEITTKQTELQKIFEILPTVTDIEKRQELLQEMGFNVLFIKQFLARKEELETDLKNIIYISKTAIEDVVQEKEIAMWIDLVLNDISCINHIAQWIVYLREKKKEIEQTLNNISNLQPTYDLKNLLHKINEEKKSSINDELEQNLRDMNFFKLPEQLIEIIRKKKRKRNYKLRQTFKGCLSKISSDKNKELITQKLQRNIILIQNFCPPKLNIDFTKKEINKKKQ